MAPTDDFRGRIDSIIGGKLKDLPSYTLPMSAFLAGVTSIIVGRKLYVRHFKRMQTGDWINPNVLARKRWIKGVVTSVGDSDNFRLYHTPGFGWRWPLKFRKVPSESKELKGQTIHIRIAGVDAPEAAHFGRPAQPYSQEALAWLRNLLLGRTVYCQLIRRDQYSRIVSVVRLSPRILPGTFFRGKNLSLEMLKAGWVTTYQQGGAEYGNSTREEYLQVEAEAKVSRRGMWENGINAETPAEYKKRYAHGGAVETSTSKTTSKPRKVKGWFASFLPLKS